MKTQVSVDEAANIDDDDPFQTWLSELREWTEWTESPFSKTDAIKAVDVYPSAARKWFERACTEKKIRYTRSSMYARSGYVVVESPDYVCGETSVYHAQLKAYAVRVEYDYGTRTGRLHIHKFAHDCDVAGCIRLFQALDAEVRVIETFSENRPLATYRSTRDTNRRGHRFPDCKGLWFSDEPMPSRKKSRSAEKRGQLQ